MSGKCFIYAINASDSWTCKIGITKNPEERLRQLQTGNASILRLVHAEMCSSRRQAEIGETLCHEFLSDKKINGEWFDVNPELASLIIVSSVLMPKSMREYIRDRVV